MIENIPDYVVAFDPGGSLASWAYSISKIKYRRPVSIYCPVEFGFLSPVENIAKPDINSFRIFVQQVKTKYPNVRIDLVAERFVVRGFATWLSEYIGWNLGALHALWDMGESRFIMASQWKRMLEKRVGLKPTMKKYEYFWEEYWMDFTSIDEQSRGVVHLQDSLAINFWYWRYEKGIDCVPEGISGDLVK
jgi:hypothetical protein